MPIRFVIALFGNRHAGMLIPLLYSISKSNPEALVSLYWEDINPTLIEDLEHAFPKLECIQTHFNFSTDITRRISSKTLVWSQAAHDKRNENSWLFFLDADMLVVKDVSSFLQRFDSDSIFTERDSPFPINSGVIVARASEKTASFFTLWLQKTDEILKNPKLYVQANNKKLPYGGADQMALHHLLHYEGYSPESKIYEIVLPEGIFRLSRAECADLNETYSRPITDQTRILHYKGGWRSILFESGPFTKNRPKKDSWEMFLYYHQTFREAVSYVNTITGNTSTVEDFGLTTPFYLDTKTFSEKRHFYLLYWLIWQMKNFFPRVKHYLTDRISFVKRFLS